MKSTLDSNFNDHKENQSYIHQQEAKEPWVNDVCWKWQRGECKNTDRGRFQPPASLQCRELIENANIFLAFMNTVHYINNQMNCSHFVAGRIPAYEALLWALNLINQDSGTINGQAVTDSYIPGIKLGRSPRVLVMMYDIVWCSVPVVIRHYNIKQ